MVIEIISVAIAGIALGWAVYTHYHSINNKDNEGQSDPIIYICLKEGDEYEYNKVEKFNDKKVMGANTSEEMEGFDHDMTKSVYDLL